MKLYMYVCKRVFFYTKDEMTMILVETNKEVKSLCYKKRKSKKLAHSRTGKNVILWEE